MAFLNSCSDDDPEPIILPTITTLPVSEITETSAKSGGYISDDGGGEITARGAVWSTEANPTLENHSGITFDDKGSGLFQSSLTDLSNATTYYVRAYAANSAGTSYGNDELFETIEPAYLLTMEVEPKEAGNVTGAGKYREGEHVNIAATDNEGWEFVNWSGDTDYINDPDSANTILTMPGKTVTLTANFQVSFPTHGDGITDIDGNEYYTVIIGDQEWMAENLRVTRDADGNDINRYCYDDDEANCELYGGLYTWHTVMNGESSSNNNPSGVQGICPTGWHVPSDAEWDELIEFVIAQGYTNIHNNPNGTGNALKSCRQEGSPLGGDCDTTEHPRWDSHFVHYGFDAFGFSLCPGGHRRPNSVYQGVGSSGNYWSSTELYTPDAWNRNLNRLNSLVNRQSFNKEYGYSLRCVRRID